jgi:hypothetical protein
MNRPMHTRKTSRFSYLPAADSQEILPAQLPGPDHYRIVREAERQRDLAKGELLATLLRLSFMPLRWLVSRLASFQQHAVHSEAQN